MHDTPCCAAPIPAKRPHLLVVDDDSDDLFLLAYSIKRAGLAWDITHAPDWEAFQTGLGAAPDIVLVDFHLRGFELAEVVRAIRHQSARCPLVVFSGANHPRVDATCRELGIELRTSKEDLAAALQILQRVLGERDSRFRAD